VDSQDHKEKTINKVDTDKTLNLVADGFEHMMNPAQEIIEKITEPDSKSENTNGSTDGVTLI
jgi:oligoribonuclease (3'-5' exoribonuclease)